MRNIINNPCNSVKWLQVWVENSRECLFYLNVDIYFKHFFVNYIDSFLMAMDTDKKVIMDM